MQKQLKRTTHEKDGTHTEWCIQAINISLSIRINKYNYAHVALKPDGWNLLWVERTPVRRGR
jgi:hypothetical protein